MFDILARRISSTIWMAPCTVLSIIFSSSFKSLRDIHYSIAKRPATESWSRVRGVWLVSSRISDNNLHGTRPRRSRVGRGDVRRALADGRHDTVGRHRGDRGVGRAPGGTLGDRDRKSTRLNSSHVKISYAV